MEMGYTGEVLLGHRGCFFGSGWEGGLDIIF